MAFTTLPTPDFQGFRRHLKSKLAVCNFLLSPNAFLFFLFFFFNASLPPFHFFHICFYVSVLTWPWNLEFGSPPSTLSCHLSLKNEYEYEEKYTATSIQGSQTVLQEEEVGEKGRRRHSAAVVLRPLCLRGPPGRAEEGPGS